MASRSLDDLHPSISDIAKHFVAEVKLAKIELLVICTLRSLEEQGDIYAQGRTKPGKIVTKAKPGTSAHNYGLALDVVPIENGKPLWQFNSRSPHPLWARVGQLGEDCGLEWFGRPNAPFVEACHFQLPNWRSCIR